MEQDFGIPGPASTLVSLTSSQDWAEFSNAEFGETAISQSFASTLLDKDVELNLIPPLPI